jgi:MFS transporter, Spinster family, sphingosine-1-phosphate transporter
MAANLLAPSDKPSSDSRQSPLPGARTALVLLLSINLFNYIDRQVLAAVVPYIRPLAQNLGDSPLANLLNGLQRLLGSNPENALIGLLAMAFMVTYMVAAPLFGWLAERASRWLLVGVGVILWSLASGGTGLAPTFGILLLTRCLVGIGEAAYGPAAPAMIADLYPVRIRGSVLAWFYMAIPVGSALGFVLGGQVADSAWLAEWGVDPASRWRWAFYLVVPPGILLGLLCLLMPEPPRGQADLKDSHLPRHAGLRDYLILLRTPSYVLDTLGMTAMTFALGGIGFWMPSYIHEFRGQPNFGRVTLIFGAIVVVAGLTATLLGGIAGDKLRARFPGSYFLVSGAAMIIGFPLSILMLYVPFPWAWIVIFLACFCLFFNTGPSNTILANVTHPAIRASAFALNILVIHAFGDVISPLVIGAITDASDKNMNIAFLFVSATVLLGGVFWLCGARYLARDTALAPTRLGSNE